MAELDPNKYHTFKAKNLYVYVVLVLVFIFVALVASIQYYEFAVTRPAQNADELTFEIRSGQSVNSISEELFEKKLINSPTIFKLYLFMNNLETFRH